MLTAAFYTLGCRLNQTESAIMAKGLENRGYQITNNLNQADLCVINSCTVTNQSNSKCRKKIRSIQKQNPQAIIAVVGCFSQISSEQISAIGGVHLILGNAEKLKLHDYLPLVDKAGTPVIRVSKLSKDPFIIETIGQYRNSTRANLKIQDGCDFICSFCVIPSARGRSRPRKPDNIREELKKLEAEGYKEVILTGVNIGTFRYETLGFLELLDLFEEFESIKRIRISSIEPTTIGTEIFQRMTGSSKLLPYLHLPLQSACNELLSKMRRRYTIEDYLSYIRQAKEEVPGICIGSDIIVGFPGESDDHFATTVQTLQNAPIDYFHVFPYAERKGTTSEKLYPKTRSKEIQRRAMVLRELSDQKREAFRQSHLDKNVEVLFETKDANGQWQGYSENYIRVAVKSNDDLKNQIKTVTIIGSNDGLALGRFPE